MCCNKSSVMSYSQYKSYFMGVQETFKLNKGSSKIITGIGVSEASLGTAIIPIPFKDLNILIDVTFQIINSYIPTLLIMKDVHENGLDVSIQR